MIENRSMSTRALGRFRPGGPRRYASDRSRPTLHSRRRSARRATTLTGLVLSGVLGLGLAAPATAQTFHDNIVSNVDVFEDTDVVSFVGDYTATGSSEDWYQGFRFTSQATGTLGSIDVAVGNYFSGPTTMEFRLYADAGGALGALLAVIPVVATAEDFDGGLRRGLFPPGAGAPPMLTQGTSYWLMATAPDATIWFNNERGESLPRLWTPNGPGGALNSDTQTAAAFRVSGPTPVPLTSPLALFLLAPATIAAGLRGLARSQRT